MNIYLKRVTDANKSSYKFSITSRSEFNRVIDTYSQIMIQSYDNQIIVDIDQSEYSLLKYINKYNQESEDSYGLVDYTNVLLARRLSKSQSAPTFIIEGIDRLGKSSLVQNLWNQFDAYSPYGAVLNHLSKPELSTAIRAIHNSDAEAYKFIQTKNYADFFDTIKNTDNKFSLIYDRGHLGELVYGPIYRKYNPKFINKMESLIANNDNVFLILLTTSNFGILKDDGKSLDFNRKEEEQALFKKAFNKSRIKNKILVDVYNPSTNTYKNYKTVYNEVLNKILKGENI